ncbi:hypothetical protein BS50DRAFT_254632 [Corynespora cassiicola Philippines]|uniref:Secreted protein n=1 Tax=Corynespora cassiicola Philippines TaxID=1448308 RepID=A0A2T2P4Y7_CORCC|nr:hypothetical protein BS50DRAFT_254632 [Corynespora cassiicola Philippines]
MLHGAFFWSCLCFLASPRVSMQGPGGAANFPESYLLLSRRPRPQSSAGPTIWAHLHRNECPFTRCELLVFDWTPLTSLHWQSSQSRGAQKHCLFATSDVDFLSN